MYYLDTNTWIYFLNGRSEQIRNKILNTDPSLIRIPTIVKAELLVGAYKSNNMEKVRDKLEILFHTFRTEDFTDEMTYTYAEIRSVLEKFGTPIGPNDLLIASIVVNKKGILITHNTREFERVQELQLEDWME